jgi:hypothetical protein
MSDFESAYSSLLRKQQQKERDKENAGKRERIELGDTTRGKSQFKQAVPMREEEPGSGGFQEIRYRGHATRRHGKHVNRAIRKAGTGWR